MHGYQKHFSFLLVKMTDKRIKIYDSIIIMFVNILCMAASMVAAVYLRYGILLWAVTEFDYVRILLQMIVLGILVSIGINSYRHFFRRGTIDELLSVIKHQFVFILCMVLWLYMTHTSSNFSRLVFAYYVIIDTALCFGAHLALKAFMYRVVRRSRSSSRLLVLTTRSMAEKVLGDIIPYNEWYRMIIGVALLDGRRDKQGAGTETIGEEKVPVVSYAEDFMEYVVHNEVDEVFVLDEDRKHMDMIVPWVQTLEEMGITVNFNIDIFDLNIRGRKNLGHVGKYAVVTISRNELSPRELFLKRCLDIAGSLVGCVILAIASLFVVPAIKLDSPGPALFKQQRVGKNGRIFTLYKFRSMYLDAEERKKALMSQNEMKGLMFKMDDDPRITKVGKFIRRTSIDELPQFINILKGDMSLVGTRPPTVDEYRQYEARHKCRLSMTPGLTGMWQVSGRSNIKDFDEVVKLDMAYIDNWTISKDIKILLKTVKIVLLRKGSV